MFRRIAKINFDLARLRQFCAQDDDDDDEEDDDELKKVLIILMT